MAAFISNGAPAERTTRSNASAAAGSLSGSASTPPSGQASRSIGCPYSGTVAAVCAARTSPGTLSSKYPVGPLPCTHPTRNSPAGAVGNCGAITRRAATLTAGCNPSMKRMPPARIHCTTEAHRMTISRDRPVTLVHDTASASGPPTWVIPRRAHGNPEYGHAPITTSRAVHRTPISGGTASSCTRPRAG